MSTKRDLTRWLTVAGVAVIVAAVAACNDDAPAATSAPVIQTQLVVVTATTVPPTATPKAEPAPKPKGAAGSLTIAIPEVAPGVGLNSLGSVAGGCRSWGCGDDLFTWSAADREAPEIAESWVLAPDQSSVTIKIRKGIKWHNVEQDWGELKASDLAWSYNEMNPAINPESIGWSAANLSATFGATPAVALDDYTLKFAFAAFDVRWANSTLNESGQVGHLPTPKAAYDSKGKEWVKNHVVSQGAYKVVSWDQGNKIVLEATGSHWKDNPKIKNVTVVQL